MSSEAMREHNALLLASLRLTREALVTGPMRLTFGTQRVVVLIDADIRRIEAPESEAWIDLDVIEATALDATSGTWVQAQGDGDIVIVDEETCIADCSHGRLRDAEFIVAAQPTVVRRLIQALRESAASTQIQGDRAEQAEILAQELGAEIAAYQGREEGAINEHWLWDGDAWGRDLDDNLRSLIVRTERIGECETWAVLRDETIVVDAIYPDDNEVVVDLPEHAGPRAGMRALEVAAKVRGWLP